MQIPRNEYPRPNMVRDEWTNLNGLWDFEFDFGNSGKDRNFQKEGKYTKQILVPFCPESKLSGIEYKDFFPACWYRRTFEITDISKRTLIHFGAVDYMAQIWVNGHDIGDHVGGYSSFRFDITDYVKEGENELVLLAQDDLRSHKQPAGKQSHLYNSYGCFYTRTTGIWQSVWLEQVPFTYISNIKTMADLNNKKIDINVFLEGDVKDGSNYTLLAESFYEGKDTGKRQVLASWRQTSFSIDLTDLYLWESLQGRLYDLKISLYKDGDLVDKVDSYFGMRSVALTDNAILINGKPVFQRLILDQGFYPDGVYTAPTDEDLKRDIEMCIAMGFNGARLHEKIFEPRFLYWADKLGYMVWEEHANWNLDVSKAESLINFLPEWVEVMNRDMSHPSIVGWCPFNETQGNQDPKVIETVYKVTREIDPTRPIIDTSGWFHTRHTDIFDVHDYEQNPDVFISHYEAFKEGDMPHISLSHPSTYKKGRPYFVSEFGGTWWSPGTQGWGYGKAPETMEEFYNRFERLVSYLLDHPKVCAFCYTQLTDVEQETNGLLTFERDNKFDPARLKKIVARKAAIEV